MPTKTIRAIIMAGFLAALLGCSDTEAQNKSSDADLEHAAMLNLWPLPSASKWFPRSEGELDRQQQWVNEKRAWLATVEDKRIRKAYAGWVDWVENNIKANREENRTHAEAKKDAANREKWDAEKARGSDLAPLIPKPPANR